jgi:hypothetical protein
MSVRKRKDEVWEKAEKICGKDPDKYRQDPCGNPIYKHSYGKHSEMGWEIDHKKAKANGGTDHLNNLQALKTSTNRKKGTGKLKCN